MGLIPFNCFQSVGWFLLGFALLVANTILVRKTGPVFADKNLTLAPNCPSSFAEDLIGCAPTKPTIFFDLGGTECVCDRSWNIRSYWEKMMTGFAFNIPHTISPFHFFVLVGRWEWITLGVFINEVVEELVLGFGGRWGFILDPPYDLEARYDSIIRDVFCCISGLVLGVKFCRIFKVKPMIETPFVWSLDFRNRHSWSRIGVGLIQGLTVWQVTLAYNSDRGARALNISNALVAVGFAVSVAVMYLMNRAAWPECSERHVLVWHVGWALCVAWIFAWVIYPPVDEFYCVFLAELSLTMVLWTVEMMVKVNFKGLATLLDLDDHLLAKNADCELPALNSGSDEGAEGPGDQIMLDDLREAIGSISIAHGSGYPACSAAELLTAISSLKRERKPDRVKVAPVPLRVWLLYGLWMLLAGAGIVVAWLAPISYKGSIMYTRHWCGNPETTVNGSRSLINACYNMCSEVPGACP